MSLESVQNGDMIFAAVKIVNDGSVPETPDGFVFAEAGTKGMLINIGHLEADPDQELFLVAFETDSGELGPPVTCLADEISDTPLAPFVS